MHRALINYTIKYLLDCIAIMTSHFSLICVVSICLVCQSASTPLAKMFTRFSATISLEKKKYQELKFTILSNSEHLRPNQTYPTSKEPSFKGGQVVKNPENVSVSQNASLTTNSSTEGYSTRINFFRKTKAMNSLCLTEDIHGLNSAVENLSLCPYHWVEKTDPNRIPATMMHARLDCGRLKYRHTILKGVRGHYLACRPIRYPITVQKRIDKDGEYRSTLESITVGWTLVARRNIGKPGTEFRIPRRFKRHALS